MKVHKYFHKYWINLSPDQKKAVAKKCKSDPEYLRHIAYGRRTPSVKFAKKLSAAIYGEVSARELRDEAWDV